MHLRALHERYGHLQEIIIQNFRAKPGTRMAQHDEPSLDEHLWTIAVARILFGAAMNIQAPPNLRAGSLERLIGAGINDWGGVSPVTPDHVNPERPWPALDALARETAAAGKVLVERLAVYPGFVEQQGSLDRPDLAGARAAYVRFRRLRQGRSLDAGRRCLAAADAGNRTSRGPADSDHRPRRERSGTKRSGSGGAVRRARRELPRGLRRRRRSCAPKSCGERVSYVVTRNINYTNVCAYRCAFCAFSKGKSHENLRGRPYDLTFEEIERRADEAWRRGAVEVCLQGGIHPRYTGETYLAICRAIKRAAPGLHIHAFSPLEIFQGAATLGTSVPDFSTGCGRRGWARCPARRRKCSTTRCARSSVPTRSRPRNGST